MKLTIPIFLFISLFLALIVPASGRADRTPRQFTIGVIAPLSGGLAEYGVALRNGIEMALQDSPELFNQIKFVFEDSRYDNRLALSAFNKLKSCDLIFSWGSGPTETIAPVAERMKRPLVALGEHTAAVGREYVIVFNPPSFLFSQALLKHLRTKGYRNYAVVISQITYLETLTDSFKKGLNDDERLRIIDYFQPDDNDFKTAIAKVAQYQPDALGVYLLSGQVSQFYRQMAAQRLQIPTFGADFLESTSEINKSSSAIDGAVYPHHFVIQNFKEQYLLLHGDDIHLPTAGRGYDFATMVARQLRNHPTVSGLELFNTFKEIDGATGVSGDYSFRSSPDTGMYFYFPIVIKEIRGGKISILAEE